MEVGVRQLRDNLSRYLERVRAGEDVVVTDRGPAAARLVPLSGERRLDQLIAEGLVEVAPSRRLHRPSRPVAAADSVSALVSDQRR